MDIRSVRLDDAGYPEPLRHIPFPPSALYICGSLPEIPYIAIVGTRKATAAGLLAAERLSERLAASGIGIVSGLALGIDAAAHKGALSAKGYTLAVLAHGPDLTYPAAHHDLKVKILSSGGAILTEYPRGTPPRAFRFLERNRIVSGLCKAVCIIEAPERSGAMATARFALEQNRDVLVLPGPAGHSNYRGSHRLIREGATLIDSPDDVLQELGLGMAKNVPEKFTPDAEAGLLLKALHEAGMPLDIDEIIKRSKLTAPAVHRSMTILILAKMVQEDAGRYKLSYFGF